MRFHRRDIVAVASSRIGFAAGGAETKLAAVLQSDDATSLLRTVLVAPMGDEFDPDLLQPFDVIVPASESDRKRDRVLAVHLMRAVPLDALSLDPVGRLSPETWERVIEARGLLFG